MNRCPACPGTLTLIPDYGYRLSCDRCSGYWLDRSGTEALVQGIITGLDESPRTKVRDRGSPYRGVVVTEQRACPHCDAPLRPVDVPEIGVRLHVCTTHGTWFDPGELSDVLQHYVDKNASPEVAMRRLLSKARDPSARARAWHPFW